MNKRDLNYHIFFVIFILFNFELTAQEINADFIDSLPDSIKQDVVKQINSNSNMAKGQSDIKNYKSFDSKIDVNYQNSQEGLKLFGSDFFRGFPSTFMPINDPSASSNYILDVDDILHIQMIGDRSTQFDIRIDRSGNISIPDIGKIQVAGMTLNQAIDFIDFKISATFVETDVFISLKEIRDIQVLLTGMVHTPGIYTLSGYSSVLHAISSAGGLKENASFREVIVKRNGKVYKTIDLYDFFVDGNMSSNISLMSGDSIIVKPTNQYIPVYGAVNQKAIYEYEEGESLKDIIYFAGGFKPEASKEIIVVRKINNSYVSIVLIKDFEIFKLKKEDKIYVNHALYRPAEKYLNDRNNFRSVPIIVSGAVKKPGTYYVNENTYLSQLINDAGGYKVAAYPFGGMLFNKRALELETEYNDRLYNEAIKSLASAATSINKVNVSSILPLLSEFKNLKPSGRITTEFNLEKIKTNPAKDTLLTPGDRIYVPYKKNVVHVFGEVLNPGSKAYTYGTSVKDYIKQSGGLNKSADKSSIILVYANGKAERVGLNSNIFGKKQSDVLPGSVIYITRDLDDIDGIQYFATISPILSSLAISLASLNSINNN